MSSSDNMDDFLDQCLDEFEEVEKTTQQSRTPSAPASSSSGANNTAQTAMPSDANVPDMDPEELKKLDEMFQEVAKSLASQMNLSDDKVQDLMESLKSSQFPPPPSSTGSQASGSGDVDMQAEITNTLKMLSQAAENLPETGDAQGLEQMMAQLQDLSSNQEFMGVMDEVVKKLVSKEVLYEPLKELSEQYPVWLAANRHTCSAEQVRTYENQLRAVNEILHTFDTNPSDTDRIISLLQEMQESSPPEELMKNMKFTQDLFSGNNGSEQ